MKPKSVALRYVQKYYPDVTKVVDAKRGTKITVKPKDCENGVSKAPNICAIAKAAMRLYDGAIVSLSRAYLIRGDTATRYQVPPHVTRELVVFDRAHAFQPGIYELGKVPQHHMLGQKTGTNTDSRKRRRKFIGKKHMPEGVRVLGSHT